MEKVRDGNLFGGFARCEEFSALPLYLGHVPRTRGTAIEALADGPAQPFEAQGVLLFHECDSSHTGVQKLSPQASPFPPLRRTQGWGTRQSICAVPFKGLGFSILSLPRTPPSTSLRGRLFGAGVAVSFTVVILRSAFFAGRRIYGLAGSGDASGECIGPSSGEERPPQDDIGEKQVPPCSLRSRVGMTR